MKANRKMLRLGSLVLCMVLCLSLLSATAAAADQQIDTVVIYGLRQPVEGETLTQNLQGIYIPSDGGYAIDTAQWWVSDNGKSYKKMNSDEKFVVGKYYYYRIWLKANDGYAFPYDESSSDVWHSYTGTTDTGLTYRYSKVYCLTNASDYLKLDIFGESFQLKNTDITSVVVSGLKMPEVGDTAAKNLQNVSIASGSGYAIDRVQWWVSDTGNGWTTMKSDERFKIGKWYYCRIWLKADAGYAFPYEEDETKIWKTYTGTTDIGMAYMYSTVYCGADSDYLKLDIYGEEFEMTEPGPVFTDVPAGSYFEDAVNWAVSDGITNGTSPTTFSPYMNCTRGQIVTFLWRLNDCPEPAGTTCGFSDVPESAYYYKAVLWAVEKGITNGTSPTTFSPDAACTRGQAMTFLWRADGKPAAHGSSGTFADVPSGAYYEEAVQWAVEQGITNGTSPTTFSPDAKCSRAHIVTFLYRYVNSEA